MVTWIAFCEKVVQYFHFSLVLRAMFRLDFKCSKANLAREYEWFDWETSDLSGLQYHSTRGKIEIWHENKLLNPDWDPYCLIDFATVFPLVAEQLWEKGHTEPFEFNEGEGEIRFERNGDLASLAIAYCALPIVRFSVGVSELLAEAIRFENAVFEDTANRHPEFRRNPVFKEMYPKKRVPH